MRNVILNEFEVLDDALNKGIINNKPSETIGVLARHYFSKNMNIEDVIEKVKEFIIENSESYNDEFQSDFIKGFIDYIHSSQRYNLVNIQAITISETEWDKIIALNDKRVEKIAFVMLVYQKINEIKKPKSSGWIKVEVSDILSEAGIQSKRENIKEFHPLYANDYIGLKTFGVEDILVKFRDINEQNKPKMIITKFDKVITYYDEHRNGNKYKECEVCGKRFKIAKTGKPPKYCTTCAKKVKSEKTVNARKI